MREDKLMLRRHGDFITLGWKFPRRHPEERQSEVERDQETAVSDLVPNPVNGFRPLLQVGN
jgi:hypothetical protein